jgi:hypothetical protein
MSNLHAAFVGQTSCLPGRLAACTATVESSEEDNQVQSGSTTDAYFAALGEEESNADNRTTAWEKMSDDSEQSDDWFEEFVDELLDGSE